VRNHAEQENIRQLARLRLARVLREQGETAQALDVLAGPFPEAFEAAVEELRGDLYLAQGERDQAREAYRKALAAPAGGGDRDLLQMKFNELRSDADDSS